MFDLLFRFPWLVFIGLIALTVYFWYAWGWLEHRVHAMLEDQTMPHQDQRPNLWFMSKVAFVVACLFGIATGWYAWSAGDYGYLPDWGGVFQSLGLVVGIIAHAAFLIYFFAIKRTVPEPGTHQWRSGRVTND